MTEAGWTSNDHAINLYTYVLGYHPDQEALEAGDDKDYNAIKRALEHSYQQGQVAGLTRGAQLVRWHKSCAFEADPALALERAAKDIESVASQIIQLT